jgi:AcrR family transcriptional regulator
MSKPKDPQKRENLVRVSLLVLSKYEYDDINIEELRKKADVGSSTFYDTFKNKLDWYEQMRCLRCKQCWQDLLNHYSVMQDTEFSEKMKHLSIYLLLYTRRNKEFRKITKGHMLWRSRFADLIRSDAEEQERFNRELNAYAVKMKMDPEEVRMNVCLLLSSAVRYGYDASEQPISIPFGTVKKNLSGISDQLFPEG